MDEKEDQAWLLSSDGKWTITTGPSVHLKIGDSVVAYDKTISKDSLPTKKSPLIDYFIARFGDAVTNAAAHQDTHGFCAEDKEHYDRMVKNGKRIVDWLNERLRVRHDAKAAVEIVDILAKALIKISYPNSYEQQWSHPPMVSVYRNQARSLLKDPSVFITKGDL